MEFCEGPARPSRVIWNLEAKNPALSAATSLHLNIQANIA